MLTTVSIINIFLGIATLVAGSPVLAIIYLASGGIGLWASLNYEDKKDE